MKLLKSLLFCLTILFCLTNTQCDDDDRLIEPVCNQSAIVNEDYYNALDSDGFSFISIEVQQDCLVIDLSSSGCDGNSWKYKLVDSGSIAESFPEQRYLKLELTNNELCLAVINKQITFDLNILRVVGSNEIVLNIDGYNEGVIYSY